MKKKNNLNTYGSAEYLKECEKKVKVIAPSLGEKGTKSINNDKLVITDQKEESLRDFRKNIIKQGYDIKVLNLNDMSLSNYDKS